MSIGVGGGEEDVGGETVLGEVEEAQIRVVGNKLEGDLKRRFVDAQGPRRNRVYA